MLDSVKKIAREIINNQNIYITNTKDKPNNIIPKNTSAVTFKNDEMIADIPPLSYLFIYLQLK